MLLLFLLLLGNVVRHDRFLVNYARNSFGLSPLNGAPKPRAVANYIKTSTSTLSRSPDSLEVELELQVLAR